jgi:RNA polymerase sigma-70 factor, ECF subfamily
MSTDPTGNTTAALDPARWLQEYGDLLFRYALGRLRDPAQAEDMVQETLLAAIEARAGYAGRASEKTWLTGILKHKIVDFIRKQVRESPAEDIGALSDAVAEREIDTLFDARGRWIRPPRDWGNPQQILENREFMEAFNYCLNRLKPVLARVFSLKELVGESTEEICKELDITTTNCGVMLYRARMGLRRCLEIRWSGGNQEEPR